MQLLDLTLSSPAQDLGLDEALLQLGEQDQLHDDVLRLWDANEAFVVLGRSGKIAREIHAEKCVEDKVPVLRRSSGGGTVVAARGCMFFSLVLSMERHQALRMVDAAHRFVMESIQSALSIHAPDLAIRGTCDLTVDGRKVSGNSLRVKRNWLLYHGTLLLDMDLSLVGRYLQHPPREPDYRLGRTHDAFVANLALSRATAASALTQHFLAREPLASPPLDAAYRLAKEKFGNPSWTYSR